MLATGFCVCLIAAALVTGAELGVGTISRDSLERLVANKVRGAKLLLTLMLNMRRFKLTFVSGRILSVTAGTLSLFMVILGLKDKLGISPGLAGLITIICSAGAFIAAERILGRFVSFGEHDDRVTRFSYFVAFVYLFLLPLTFVLDRIIATVSRQEDDLAEKGEAFIELVKTETESGVIEQEEREMIQSIFEFSDTSVKEVMVPRIDVVAAENTISIEELIGLFREKGHSRIPVYQERIDNILGVIYAKDLLIHIARNETKEFSITDIMRDAYFVPESKKLSDLLKELKTNKVHIAMVVDEYGGTAGIVALEDIIEEIVGDIQDEYDHDERDYVWINDLNIVMDAGLDIDDVNEIIRTDIPDEHFDTLGGFLYDRLGFIPEGGEEVQWNEVTFVVKEITGNRIGKVLVKLNEPILRSRSDQDDGQVS